VGLCKTAGASAMAPSRGADDGGDRDDSGKRRDRSRSRDDRGREDRGRDGRDRTDHARDDRDRGSDDKGRDDRSHRSRSRRPRSRSRNNRRSRSRRARSRSRRSRSKKRAATPPKSTEVPPPAAADQDDKKAKRSKWDEKGPEMPDWLKDAPAPKVAPPRGPQGPTFKVIRMKSIQIRILLGKGGETIREITQRTGADIKVDNHKDDAEGNVSIVGDIERTEAVIREVLTAKGCPLPAELTGSASDARPADEEELSVPVELVGLFIGKKGENITNMRNQAGGTVFIGVQPVEPGSTVQKIQIVGDNRLKARDLVVAKINEVCNYAVKLDGDKTGRKGRPHAVRGGAPPPPPPPGSAPPKAGVPAGATAKGAPSLPVFGSSAGSGAFGKPAQFSQWGGAVGSGSVPGPFPQMGDTAGGAVAASSLQIGSPAGGALQGTGSFDGEAGNGSLRGIMGSFDSGMGSKAAHEMGASGIDGGIHFASGSGDFGKGSMDFGKGLSGFGKSGPDFGKSGPDFGRSGLDFGKSGPDFAKSGPDFGKGATQSGSLPGSWPAGGMMVQEDYGNAPIMEQEDYGNAPANVFGSTAEKSFSLGNDELTEMMYEMMGWGCLLVGDTAGWDAQGLD